MEQFKLYTTQKKKQKCVTIPTVFYSVSEIMFVLALVQYDSFERKLIKFYICFFRAQIELSLLIVFLFGSLCDIF